MTDKVKKYIKIGAASLIVLFAMNRCTVACNRANELEKSKKYSSEYVDSIQNVLNANQKQLDSLYVENKMLKQDTSYLINELKSLGATNKALLERDRTVNVQIKHKP